MLGKRVKRIPVISLAIDHRVAIAVERRNQKAGRCPLASIDFARTSYSVAAREPPLGHHFVVRACGILISVGSKIRGSNTAKSRGSKAFAHSFSFKDDEQSKKAMTFAPTDLGLR
jgi:hypothetical protein